MKRQNFRQPIARSSFGAALWGAHSSHHVVFRQDFLRKMLVAPGHGTECTSSYSPKLGVVAFFDFLWDPATAHIG